MRFSKLLIWTCLLLVGCLHCAGGEKVIRLRNGPIQTPEPDPNGSGLGLLGPAEAVSGLYLVQFNGSLQAAWRESLKEVGVELVRYVPDDAFVVRLRNARLGVVRRHSFVRWVGAYQPEHKLHHSLQAVIPPELPHVRRQVRVLLDAGADVNDLAQLRRVLRTFRRQSASPFGIILQGTADADQLAVLGASASVLWVEPAPVLRLWDEVASKTVGGSDDTVGVGTATQQMGYDGRGVVVSVADSGLDTGNAATIHPDLAGRVEAFFHYGSLENAADQHGHGTHVAGIIAGDGAAGERDDEGRLYGLGVASQARLVIQRLFDREGNFDAPPSMEVLARDAVRAGAVIGSNSWGDDTQGRYDLHAAEFDALVRDVDAETAGDQPYILEFSAGNAGPASQTIGSPAVAKNVIATGASQSGRSDLFMYGDGTEAMADFSSRGPCEDGRLKPDLVAPGTWIASLQSAAASDANAWLPISSQYQYQGGTSQSGPHVAGAAAVFVQYHRELRGGATPSPALVKAALINGAVDLNDAEGGTKPVPNMDEGWGRVALTNLIGASSGFVWIDQEVALTNGQIHERRVVVSGSDRPFKVTLAYTDVPGLPAALPALVNDLDLEVIGPDGTVYHGNQFAYGNSVPNPQAWDRLNNVEAVHLWAPLWGEYVVRVRGRAIQEDIRRRVEALPEQDFALVMSGEFAQPGEGVLVFDRGAYRVPGEAGLRLVDFDLADQSDVMLTVRSRGEPGGEQVTLLRSGVAGVFTNRLTLALGGAQPDGVLQVESEDQLQAIYLDASPREEIRAEARVDLVPPRISQATVTNRFQRAVLQWTTDEPASSWVTCTTNGEPALKSGSGSLSTDHVVVVDDLVPGLAYRFVVASADEAGNLATYAHGGLGFEFVPLAVPTVLLVDDYNDLVWDVPVESYVAPLEQVGVSFEVWSVAEQGRTPRLEEIRPYRVVMWRVPEFLAALSADDVRTLRDYVEGGGALFMASMELLSRLDESGFSSFRRHVLQVDSFEADAGVPTVLGVSNYSLASGLRADLDFSHYQELTVIPRDISDTMTPTTNAAPILVEAASGRTVGLRYPRTGDDRSGRVVLFTFPLDAVPLDEGDRHDRADLLRSVLSFLLPGWSGTGTVELDRARYAVPGRATVEVVDPHKAEASQVAVTMKTGSLPSGQSIVLYPTSRPGLFRGSVMLVDSTNAVAQGVLPLRDGEEIQAEYGAETGESRQVLKASAGADTAAPRILEITVEPDYSTAIVRWKSLEPADSLVQFGESRFLSRTAYAPLFQEEHQLRLEGLLPDREYFFQVASRDAAGNTTVDDHQGRLYSFRTLKPLVPPFLDSMDADEANWSVLNQDRNGASGILMQSATWERGKPVNSMSQRAHSGDLAWGTNLRDAKNDYANTSLISPALDLRGGNLAVLRFWHAYDFTPKSPDGDILEIGGVYASTNNGAAWMMLKEFRGRSDAWVEEEIDMSPLTGSIVRLGWGYALFSIDPAIHPGWLVDDVSVELSNVSRGTLTVSNNLSQASFTVQGAETNSGSGLSWTRTNAPPGAYVVTFAAVPFWTTPDPITNRLAGSTNLVFAGLYTMPDENANGLSDLWELHYWGILKPAGSASVDSDQDGFGDWAEFMAGTDPTRAESALLLQPPIVLPGGMVHLSWESSFGRGYRVEGSTNLQEWIPFTSWIRGVGEVTSVMLPPMMTTRNHVFRLEVRP